MLLLGLLIIKYRKVLGFVKGALSFLVSAFLLDVEVFDLIGGAICCNNVEEFSEAVLLQVLLREILEVTFGETYLCLYADSLLIADDFH